MSWLFGTKKKSAPKPPDPPAPVSETSEGFVCYPPLPPVNNPYPSVQPLPYPAPQAQADFRPGHLDSVQFRLSPKFSSGPAVSSDLTGVYHALARTRHLLTSSEFNYSFELERNIVREANLSNDSKGSSP